MRESSPFYMLVDISQTRDAKSCCTQYFSSIHEVGFNFRVECLNLNVSCKTSLTFRCGFELDGIPVCFFSAAFMEGGMLVKKKLRKTDR